MAAAILLTNDHFADFEPMNKLQNQRIADIIETVADMTLATNREDGFPQANTISYANDGLILYFGTSKHSQKAENIRRDNKVSLTINKPYRFWKDILGLSMGGIATEVSDSLEFQKVGKLLFTKFPEIHDYARTEDEHVSVFRIDPVVISLLNYSRGFGHTETINVLGDN